MSSNSEIISQKTLSLAKISLIGLVAICTAVVTSKISLTTYPIVSLDWDEEDELEIQQLTAEQSEK